MVGSTRLSSTSNGQGTAGRRVWPNARAMISLARARAAQGDCGGARRPRRGGGGVLQHRPLLHQHTRKRVQLPGQPPRRSAARTSPRRLARSAPCSSTLAAGSSAHHPRTSTEFRAHARALAPALAPSRPSPYDGKSHWCTEQLKRRINGAKPFPLPDSRGEQLPVSGRNAGKGGCKSNLRSIVHCC